MDRSHVLTLIRETMTQDAIGQQVPTEVRREVFCDVVSVSAEEFFQAGKIGLRAQFRSTVFAPDYAGEEVAELDGLRYGIYRTYLRRTDEIELYLERKGGI